MGLRSELHSALVAILGSDAVYFQPPPTTQMVYPCIVYHRDFITTSFADNLPYRRKKRYLITVITANPDDPLFDKIAELPTCVFDRFLTANQLNHETYKLFF